MNDRDPFVDVASAFRMIEETLGLPPGTLEVTIPRADFTRFLLHPVFGQLLKFDDPKAAYGSAPAMVAGRIYRPRPNAEQTSDKPSDITMSDGRKQVGKASENSTLDTDIIGKNGG